MNLGVMLRHARLSIADEIAEWRAHWKRTAIALALFAGAAAGIVYKLAYSPFVVLDAGQFLFTLYLGVLGVMLWYWRYSPRQAVLAWLILIFTAAAGREGVQELAGGLYVWPEWAVNLAAVLRIVKAIGLIGLIRELTYSRCREWCWAILAALAALYMVIR